MIKNYSFFIILKKIIAKNMYIQMICKYLYFKWLIVMFFALCSVEMLGNEYQITYLSAKDGLSQNEVTSIYRDKSGFMWFGTRGGLNRYDGYEFRHYKPLANQNSLQNPSIERLYGDRKGNIWIGTKSGGFSVYGLKKERFYHAKDSLQRFPNRVISFYEDMEDNVWMGSWPGGLFQLNSDKKIVKHYLGNDRVNSIIATEDTTIWCGTINGLRYKKGNEVFKHATIGKGNQEVTEIIKDPRGPYLWMVGWNLHLIKFNYEDFTFKQYRIPFELTNKPANTYSIEQDINGNIWVGTWSNGLFLFDTTEELFQHIDIKPEGTIASNIDYDVILDIFQDNIGDIWLGTDGGGVVKLAKKTQFKNLNSDLNSKIKKQHINAICVDSKNQTWIGTKGSGLFVSSGMNNFEHVGFDSKDPLYNTKGIIVKCVYEDSDKNIWVSINEGLYIADKDARGKYTLMHSAPYFKSPQLRFILKAHDISLKGDDLWIATQQRGIFYYKRVNGVYEKVRQYTVNDQDSKILDNRVTSIVHDDKNRMWIGSYKGLMLFEPSDSTFIPLTNLLGNDQEPLCDIVLSVHIDPQNNIWFGTPCSLNKLSEKSGKFNLQAYTRDSGLPDDYINGILSDENNNIWISSNSGISQLNPETGVVGNYDESDGIGGMNYSESACFKDKNGNLYFGGYSHLTYFNPKDIEENKISPQVAITNFKILNKEVPIEDKGILPYSINYMDKLVLTHNEEEFSIEYAALDYKAPIRNQYKYWLEGYNDDWIYAGSRRHISFSNLRPGDYVLHLTGSNSNGVWNEKGYQLAIEVLPPPWKTWYAVLIYVLLLMMVVVLITFIAKKQERLENKIHMEMVMREKEHQMNEYKLKSFTNISHEIRTPLTLILAPANELLKREFEKITPGYFKDKVNLIYQNTNRLYNLVNQLLEFRKMEAGKVKLEAAKLDLSAFFNEIVFNFEEFAKIKDISFQKKVQGKDWMCYFDQDKLRVVVNNLLSNAFKYAGTPAEIGAELKEEKDFFSIKVTNNGKGIPSEDIEHLFERFYQASSGKHDMGSSGIGLALVKNFVKLHHGHISVESEPDKYTWFTVTLNKGDTHLSPDEIQSGSNESISEVVSAEVTENPVRTKTVNIGTKGATVVVVEDNAEVRSYVTELLSEQYHVLEAEDGMQGLDLVIEHKPQAVISDVMMPKMDGFELCQKIKENDLISHIPVILLTAKGTMHDQLFATKKGADVYLTKPFSPELLLEKVNMVIASRKLLTDKFSQIVKLEAKDTNITAFEGNFLKETIAVIEKHMGDFNFDPDQLASELAMSPSTFYRKIKKLTDKTPGRFIKSIRLKRAAQLLEETELSVSEIIENVGYLDAKNFRANFKDTYQMTPLEYRKKAETKK
ncbi:response regulator [Labilibacter sediminis]|nr:response regulator [Labilibacter sediminis]